MYPRIAIAMITVLLAVAPCLAAPPPQLDVREVAPGVHAVIGDLGGQSTDNEGLNANLGFVIGNESVLVINSGPSYRIGEALLGAIRARTALPVKWLVNVNSQSHYWWGNAVFAAEGSTLLAHDEAVGLMRAQEDAQRTALDAALGPLFTGSQAMFPQTLDGERQLIDLGGRVVEIVHFGPAHTPGDVAVWIPDAATVFAGDIVYTERLLAVLPISSSAGWVEAFAQLEALTPHVIVPGHGAPTNLVQARKETLDYLTHMRAAALQQVEAGASPSEATGAIDQSAWSQLVNFDLLAPGNASRIFLEVEIEAF
ncbi:MAG: MBL fold metallo-hydrolase [Pseudazoarcus pumilus]|nr:MBL fold metallo-hydrolase [Pseudazoarcus pumilus]